MAQPIPYDRQANFSNYETLNPTSPKSGTSLDAEFNSVKVSLDETQANLALIQRDDGRLANASVGLDQLAPSLTMGFTLRGGWIAPENYVLGDGVTYDNGIWRATSSHLSALNDPPTESNTLWELLLNVADLQPVVIPDGSVTTAKLQNDAVTTAKLDDGAVTPAKLSDDAIPVFVPQGRLTLTSGLAVLGGAVSAAATVYYTPYVGAQIPIRNKISGAWQVKTFAQLSNVLANSATGNAGPAAAVASKVYDLYVWDTDGAGTMALTRSPAWDAGTGGSNTARGTGAGGSAMTREANGIFANTVDITNGPDAGYGTYVGTIMTDASGATVSFVPNVAGSAGGSMICGLWNMYNRCKLVAFGTNTNASWTVLSATVREVQSGPFRFSFVSGRLEDCASAIYSGFAESAAAATAQSRLGLGLDKTTSFDASAVFFSPTAAINRASPMARLRCAPLLGAHYIAALENSDGVNSGTFYGGSVNGGLTVDWWF